MDLAAKKQAVDALHARARANVEAWAREVIGREYQQALLDELLAETAVERATPPRLRIVGSSSPPPHVTGAA